MTISLAPSSPVLLAKSDLVALAGTYRGQTIAQTDAYRVTGSAKGFVSVRRLVDGLPVGPAQHFDAATGLGAFGQRIQRVG